MGLTCCSKMAVFYIYIITESTNVTIIQRTVLKAQLINETASQSTGQELVMHHSVITVNEYKNKNYKEWNDNLFMRINRKFKIELKKIQPRNSLYSIII